MTIEPEVGQLHLERIVQPHGDHLVTARQAGQRGVPTRAG